MTVVLGSHVMLNPFQRATLLATGYTLVATEYNSIKVSCDSDRLNTMAFQGWDGGAVAYLHVSHVLVEGRARVAAKETEFFMKFWSLYLIELRLIPWPFI